MGCLRIVHDQGPELRVVRGKKGVTSNCRAKSACSSYLFGMLMPDRHDAAHSSPYTYGFNDMERDEEVKGAGKHCIATYWEYDPRVVTRWNTDPVVKHHESPYAVFANNPIWFVDPNGADTSFADNAVQTQFNEAYKGVDNVIKGF